MNDADIERRAAEMAAAVDARLSGTSVLEASVNAYHAATVAPAKQRRKRPAVLGRGLTEEELHRMLQDAGEADDDVFAVASRCRISATELESWIKAFTTDLHDRSGWPRQLDRFEYDAKTKKGIIFDTTEPFQMPAPRWLKEWKCLWFLMKFYKDGPTCAAEWGDTCLNR